MAALPEPSAALDAPKPAAEPPSADLARDIQRELVRLGCSTSKVDGKWGRSTGAALRRFNKSARASLDTDVAASETLSELRAHDGRICAPAAREENKTSTIERDTPRKPRRAEHTPEPRRVPPRRVDVEIRQPRVLPSPAAPRARAPEAPASCFFDEGYGRKRPCDAGTR